MTKALQATEDRIHYALRLGAVALVTGEIGSGKSTTLRYMYLRADQESTHGNNPMEVSVTSADVPTNPGIAVFKNQRHRTERYSPKKAMVGFYQILKPYL